MQNRQIHYRMAWKRPLTCWRFKTVTWDRFSSGSDSQEPFTHHSTAAGRQHKSAWSHTPIRTDRKHSPRSTAFEGKAVQILCSNSLSLEMPANIPYTLWLWSLTLKFRNSRELRRIQQPVCQLTGTKDVASKLLPPIHIPGPCGNTNTLEACEFKLTLWHGLQNTWSHWQKRGLRKEEWAVEGWKAYRQQ